jgi:hypothetical protein
VPEIAEREPKVTSAGLVHVGASFRGCLLCIMVLSLSSLPGVRSLHIIHKEHSMDCLNIKFMISNQ